MKSFAGLKLHIIFIAAVLLLQFLLVVPEIGYFSESVIFNHNLIEVFFKFFFFYTAYYFFLPVIFRLNRFVLFSALYILFIFLFNVLFTFLFIHFRYPMEAMPQLFSGPFRSNYFDLITYDFAYAVMGVLFRVSIEWYKKSKKQDEIAMQNLVEELSLLHSRINSEFLFAVLDKISSLIPKDPTRASDTVIKLSNVMWYMLYDAGLKTSPLEEEIRMIGEYAALQNLLFDEQVSVSFNNNWNLPGISLPPLIFFPIVEDAIRQCRDSEHRACIKIELSGKLNFINFAVAGNCTESSFLNNQNNTIENARKRLGLFFENNFNLDILHSDNEYSVKLQINYV